MWVKLKSLWYVSDKWTKAWIALVVLSILLNALTFDWGSMLFGIAVLMYTYDKETDI